jgi:hypothetical protein
MVLDHFARHVAVMSLMLLPLATLVAQDPVAVPSRVSLETDTWLQISGITEAGAPRVFDDLVVLSYEQPGFARYVAAAFEHENFQRLHIFTAREREDESDLFYLAYPVDPGMEELRYRIVVDGVWMTDPNAPEVVRGAQGVTLGRITLREAPPYRQQAPVVHDDGTVTFYFSFDIRIAPTFETVDARQISTSSFRDPQITLVGTFNAWDPFMHRLEGPNEDGFYTIRIPVPPGSHYYYYMVNGQRVLDPLNRQQARDLQSGGIVSLVRVDRR